MRWFVAAALIVAGVVHLLPVAGVAGPRSLALLVGLASTVAFLVLAGAPAWHVLGRG